MHSSAQNQTASSTAKKDASASPAAAAQGHGLKGASFDEAVQMLAPPPAAAAAKGVASAAAAATTTAAAAKAAASLGAPDPNGVLDGVHPAMAAKLRSFIAIAHARGLNIKITEGMRSFQRQNELYAQGRTKPGAKVTNAKGGQSFHNYGVAVDVAFHGPRPYDESHPWSKLGAAGEAAGLAWGGHWGDRPHFELAGFSIGTLQKWYADGGMKNVWNKITELHGGPTFDKDGGHANQHAGGGIYKVRPGDTLGAIAERLLGSPQKWREIAAANGIADPEKLRVGLELRIPGWKGSGGGDAGSQQKPATHVVAPGDTLIALALRYLGNGNRWREIADANGIADPRAMKIGATLKIPGGGAGQGSEKKAAPRTYVVKPGDTLSAIAQRLLGSAQKWRELAAANNIADPTRLKVGTTLTIA